MQQDQNETRALSPKNTPSPVNAQPPIAATEKLKVTSLDDGSNLETGLPDSSETSAAIAPDVPAIANTPSPTQGQQEANEAFPPWEREASLRDSVRGPRCNRSLLRQSLEYDRLRHIGGRYRKGPRGDSNSLPSARRGPSDDSWNDLLGGRKSHKKVRLDTRPLTKAEAVETLQRRAKAFRDCIAREKAKEEAARDKGPTAWSNESRIAGTTEARLRGELGQWCIEMLERITDVESVAREEATRQARRFRAKGNGCIGIRERHVAAINPSRIVQRGEFFLSSIEHWAAMAGHCERVAELIAGLPGTNGHTNGSERHD